ncbi:alpha/beta fold hydrolase [Pseudonocardia spinosispora]|uniref:alpha/beta fold hydrolase n=1 Tax=Pseudonocardia spinosispora TaxID=103441 RepID=UPI00041475A2|nr:alpha/beta hydrolase [Pseudonocardia spinosispora]
MTATLTVPGARLHYEVRGSGPLVVLLGAPMHAEHFAPLAEHLGSDHTVLTTDPRGINRSSVDDPGQDSTPGLRADDVAHLLSHLAAGPAAVFGSSGGAVTALALATAHPDLVHTVVAHEPPLITMLPDREERRAATEDITATYLAGDPIGAWTKFCALAGIPLPQVQGPPPEQSAQQLADERFWFAHEMRGSSGYEPEIAALRTGPPRIVIGIGHDSTDQLCDHTSRALAAELGIEPVMFPGGHVAFTEIPEAFAGQLRPLLR